MTKSEFADGLTLIGEIFNKQYSQLETEIYYDLVKNYNNNVWNKAISKIIENEKFAPKPVDLLRVLEDVKKSMEYPIIDLMIKDGYFKRPDDNLKKYQLELEELKAKGKPTEFKEQQIINEIDRMSREELNAIKKVKMWLLQETIPEWLLKDMRKYYQSERKLLN